MLDSHPLKTPIREQANPAGHRPPRSPHCTRLYSILKRIFGFDKVSYRGLAKTITDCAPASCWSICTPPQLLAGLMQTCA